MQLGLRDWPSLLQHHLGFAVLAALGVLVALLTPFVGQWVGVGRDGLCHWELDLVKEDKGGK